MMDHDEARELLELAAVEPDGFERLAAGDTSDAAALAGHLAGCPTCAAAYEALAADAETIRTAIREQPPADLRARTLAFVAAAGRPRGETTAGPPGLEVVPDRPLAEAARPPAEATPTAGAFTRRWRPAWLVAAAAVVVAVIGLGGWWSASTALDAERSTSADLASLTTATLRVAAQPDARLVALTGTSGDGAIQGALSFSGATQEIVVVAEGLAEPAPGSEYGCWIEVGGVRTRIGTMYLGGGLAYWAGWSDAVRGLEAGTRFGVSLESGGGASGDPILVGEL